MPQALPRDEALAHHLETLTKAKRALLDLGEELREERPADAHMILQVCRAISISSRQLVQASQPAQNEKPDP